MEEDAPIKQHRPPTGHGPAVSTRQDASGTKPAATLPALQRLLEETQKNHTGFRGTRSNAAPPSTIRSAAAGCHRGHVGKADNAAKSAKSASSPPCLRTQSPPLPNSESPTPHWQAAPSRLAAPPAGYGLPPDRHTTIHTPVPVAAGFGMTALAKSRYGEGAGIHVCSAAAMNLPSLDNTAVLSVTEMHQPHATLAQGEHTSLLRCPQTICMDTPQDTSTSHAHPLDRLPLT